MDDSACVIDLAMFFYFPLHFTLFELKTMNLTVSGKMAAARPSTPPVKSVGSGRRWKQNTAVFTSRVESKRAVATAGR